VYVKNAFWRGDFSFEKGPFKNEKMGENIGFFPTMGLCKPFQN